MRSSCLGPLWLAVSLAACQSVSPDPSGAGPLPSTTASRGQAFAEASCAGCHAVGSYGSSSNPNAPPFAYIANQEGLTDETLSYWLRGAHNYPSEMNFSLNARQVNELTAYMLTLRSPNYRRPSD
jgi:mono/diheme cytochrome c family protein